MIKRLGDFNKFVSIAGFRNAKIADVDVFFDHVRKKVEGAHVQFFDAQVIAGWEHLFFACLNALNAFKNKQNISNSLAVESLLFASAQRQISKAVEMLGINIESSKIAVLIVAETRKKATTALQIISKIISGERDDSSLELTEKKMEGIKRLFDISDLELQAKLRKKGLEREALVDLVIEHGALLATRR